MKKEAPFRRNHKDRLFNFIFGSEENRAWTLQLYNAVNGSHYDDPSLIKFNTLKDVLYISMNNDTSFLISDILNVYEHQSSYNPNMPLRMLQYVDDLYSGYIAEHKLNKYGSSLIKLPVPRLVVFYNGHKDIDDETILRLSDSYPENLRSNPDIEVSVRMLNINYGKNKALLDSCQPLNEYAWFINEINNNLNNCDTSEAVSKAISIMPKEFQIYGFLIKHRSEVEGMLDTEYNEAEIKELFMEDGRKEAREEGIKAFILDKLEDGIDKDIIIKKLIKHYKLTMELALDYYNRFSS